MVPVRLKAIDVLSDIFHQKASLATLFPKALKEIDSLSDQKLLKALCYETLRFYPRLNAILEKLLQKPLKAKDFDIKLIIILGLCQLIYMDIKPHAVVNETVKLVILKKKQWAKGLVNALLRRFLREKDQLLKSASDFYEEPKWLIDQLKIDWPKDCWAILKAYQKKSPMILRVNLLKTNREKYLLALEKTGISAKAHPLTKEAIELIEAVDVNLLPQFEKGFCSVQDVGAQLAAHYLELKPNLRVLDACAAPGGKATHILEVEPSVDLTAIEIERARLSRINENLKRLGQSAKVICADVLDLKSWWDGKPFDRILLDAPCSGTGVIARHPDIKYLRRKEDIDQLAKVQLTGLKTLWPLLKPEGIFVYATCSLLKAENEKVIETFLEHQKEVKLLKAQQLLPGVGRSDGFFYAILMHEN